MLYIVTPCLNATDTIDQTILSIVSQAGAFEIYYHVQDGGSNDGTLNKLSAWEERLNNSRFPIQCKEIHFTYDSSSDSGLYDAIVKGFKTFYIPPYAFMTWLNADDILMPGSMAFINRIYEQFNPKLISWVTGAGAIFKDNIQILHQDRCTPTQIVKEGLCDGIHWHFIQQEGTYFRNWLWELVEHEKIIKKYKYAGDWSYWRFFATQTELISLKWPLGGFQIREGQLSQKHIHDYWEEIDKTIGKEQRADKLKELVESVDLKKRELKVQYPSGKIILTESTAQQKAYYFFRKHFGYKPNKPCHHDKEAQHVIFDQTKSKAKNNTKIMIEPNDFSNFTFAKRFHWELFSDLDIELFGHKIDLNNADLKRYQDLLVFAFIKDHIPTGSNILEIGGGNSRILRFYANICNCWNIDKLEGLGNGPKQLKSQPFYLVEDYMGSFNPNLPDNYFDFVFSISALEHVPKGDTSIYDNIIKDIQRVLKPGSYSLHAFDIVFRENGLWTHPLIGRIFELIKCKNTKPKFNLKGIEEVTDLYYMSEKSYNNTWMEITQKSYQEFGKPSSLNILWQKE